MGDFSEVGGALLGVAILIVSVVVFLLLWSVIGG